MAPVPVDRSSTASSPNSRPSPEPTSTITCRNYSRHSLRIGIQPTAEGLLAGGIYTQVQIDGHAAIQVPSARQTSKWWQSPRIRLCISRGGSGVEEQKQMDLLDDGVVLKLGRETKHFRVSTPDRSTQCLLFREKVGRNHWRLTFYAAPEPTRWMADLSDTASLANLYLPGTHESMALYGFPISSCQTASLKSQLEGGMRFLDLRFALKHGHLAAYHGIQNEYLTAEEAFGAVYDFLEERPSETIVISIKQENASKFFEEEIWRLLDKRKDMWYSENRWPDLGEVRGKAVCFCRFGFDSQRGLHPAYWPDNALYPWQSEIGGQPVVVQDWYSIGSFVAIPQKANLVLSILSPIQSIPTKSKITPPLRINFASGATMITAFPFVVAKGLGAPSILGLGVRGVNSRILEGLLKFGKEPAGTAGAILLLDYYESPGGLAELMIAWNFIL